MSAGNFTALDLDVDLGDILQEFNEVVEELAAPPQNLSCAYEHLIKAKRRSGLSDGVTDSGIADAVDGSEPSHGRSLNTSVEELNTAAAKLGDTSDLQTFIENLDKELAEM